MFELEKNEYKKILSLIEKYCNDDREVMPVIKGHNIGRIFVDDKENPALALVWTNWEMYFFIGQIKNQKVLKEVKDIIEKQLIPHAKVKEHDDCCLITYPDLLWSEIQPEIKELYPHEFMRINFNLKADKFKNYQLTSSKKFKIEGGIVQKIDKILLADFTDSDLADDILMHWSSFDNFLAKGLGYCCLIDRKIVGACFSALVTGKNQSIQIYTEEGFRKQGIAEHLCKIFIQDCLEKDFNPTWETQTFNKASSKLAEKLGFEPVVKFPMYAIYLTEENRLLWNAYLYRDKEDFEKAAFFFEKSYELEKSKNK